jgi:hypothetical protein
MVSSSTARMASKTSITALRRCFVDRVRGSLSLRSSGANSRNIRTAHDGISALSGLRRPRALLFRFALGIVPPKDYDKLTILGTGAQRLAMGDPLRQRHMPLHCSHPNDKLVHLLMKVNIVA